MKKLLWILLFTLAACGPNANKQYETANQSKWNKTTIEVHWVKKSEVSDICKGFGTNDGGPGGENATYAGCAFSKPDDITVCEIYAVQPEDFDDHSQLETFGHESWHCFGAKHN
jgi:hypothetical protein